MTSTIDAADQALLLQNRLQTLGVSNLRDRERLAARLRRQASPSETLLEAFDRRLCEWIGQQPLKSGFMGSQSIASRRATAEAAVVLSGVAARWPLALFDDRRLPDEALRRLELAMPVAAPPVVPVSMPVQELEPVTLAQVLPKPVPERTRAIRVRAR